MTELIPRLHISNWHEAKDSRGMHVVTCAHDSPFVGQEHFKLVDGPGNSADMLVAAVEAVCAAYRAGKNVLVHCVGGRSRSAAVVVAAAKVLTGKSLCEMYDLLLAKHDFTGGGARIHPYLSVLLVEKYG